MTQRERLPDDQNERVVYNTTPEPVRGHVSDMSPGNRAQTYEQPVQNREVVHDYATPEVAVQNNIETPIDRVRWGAILAGLFSALSTLALLSLLGLAIGASSVDPGDRAGNFGLGAGIWGGLSALLAFLVGGWVAARTAAVRGERNGMLNGALVWAVAIPLLLFLLSSGISSLVGTAATVGSQAAGAAAGQAADQANTPALQATAQAGVEGLQNLATPENVTNAASSVARGAWGTLGSLLLGLGASALGGYLGARTPNMLRNRRQVLG